MIHVHYDFGIGDYVDCQTGQILSLDDIQEIKLSGCVVLCHLTWGVWNDYMTLPVEEYKNKYYNTNPIEL